VSEESCIACNRCQQVCPVNVRVHETPNDPACIRCLACMRECPTHSISVEALNWTLKADRGG
jgi:ferredoxin-type protein NapH